MNTEDAKAYAENRMKSLGKSIESVNQIINELRQRGYVMAVPLFGAPCRGVALDENNNVVFIAG